MGDRPCAFLWLTVSAECRTNLLTFISSRLTCSFAVGNQANAFKMKRINDTALFFIEIIIMN